MTGIEERFTEIYKRRYWSSGKTQSGEGSTLAHTKNLRNKLPELFSAFSIRSIFDAPCGDLNWMKRVLRSNDLNYIGGDIVLPVIERLRAKYSDPKTKFIHIDLTRSAFPFADLMICRDCLFHLSFADTKLVLQNFVDSKIPYLLTATHKGNFQNEDITTGHYRLINLFAAPYHFPHEVQCRIDDWRTPHPQKEMCLWTRGQIISALGKWEAV
jgi:hypothetical protein